MNSHLIIFNRGSTATTPGWIHIVPKGELPNREAGIVQVLDDDSLDSILRNIQADQQRLGDKWPGIYAGREHFIYNDDQDSAALAWFKEFEKRPDGLWAKDDGLTDIGRDVLKNGHYKFTSFVADRRHTQKLTEKSATAPAKYRILKLDTIGFTNNANGKELLTPITNRSTHALASGKSSFAQSTANNSPSPGGEGRGEGEQKISNSKSQTRNSNQTHMQNLLTTLNLPADSGEESILAEITRLKNRNTELETQNSGLLNEQVDGLFTTHGVKEEKLRNRLKLILVTLKNRDERIAALHDFGFKPVEPKEARAARVLNRGEGTVPTPAVTDTSDESLAAKAEAEINDYQVRNRCTYAEARNSVRSRKPELFGLSRQP